MQHRSGCRWAAALLIAALGPQSRAAVLYAVGTFQPAQDATLYRIDTSTGAATAIGPTGVDRLGGLAFDAAGTLFGYTSGMLYTLNTQTGAATPVGPLGLSLPEGGLSFRPSDGTLFGFGSLAAGDVLVTINTQTGAATVVGQLGPEGRDPSGLTFTPQGELYALATRDGLPDTLIRIDPQTAAVTTIGQLGTNISLATAPTVAGLEFHPETNVLYYSDGATLYSVSRTSGFATPIGPHGVTQISGLAAPPIPEPGFVLLAAAAAAFPRRRRRGMINS
jgi:hypothetical protein